MAVQYAISTHSVALLAATAKTVIEIPTGASAAFQVIGLEVSFSATAAGSARVEWGTFTVTGTGTTVTAQKYGTDQGAAAVLGTVKIANTVEPTGFAAGTMPSWCVPLPGMYSILFPQGRELYQPISILRCLRVTSTLACNVEVNLYIEQ